MRIKKIIKEAAGYGVGSGITNDLKLEGAYPTLEQIASDTPQYMHGLRSALKTYAKLFKNIDPFTSPESVRVVGVDYGKRIGVLITKFSIPFKTVESTLRELVSAEKAADLSNPRKMLLALDLLASAVRQIKPDYSINLN